MGGRRVILIALAASGLSSVLAAGCGGDDDTADPVDTSSISAAPSASDGSGPVDRTVGPDGGGIDLDSVQWGPDNPPVPSEYGAWAPSEAGRLQCDLSAEAPDDPFWDVAEQICRALNGESEWPMVSVPPSPPANESPYHSCLDGELVALLERALAWHAAHPGETPTLGLPAPGEHSPCQRSLYAVEATIDREYPACDEIPTPRVQIELIAPGEPPEGNDPPARVRDEPSCVPQDARDDGFRRLRIMVAAQTEPRTITIDVESDYGTLSADVVVPGLDGGQTDPTSIDSSEPSTEPTEPTERTEPTESTEPAESTTVTDGSL